MEIRARRTKVPVFVWKEGRSYVAYTPALDMSSCGKSPQQAQRRFESAVNLFLDELEEMGTLDEVLSGLGWEKQEHPRREWIPPHLLKHTQMEVRVPAHR